MEYLRSLETLEEIQLGMSCILEDSTTMDIKKTFDSLRVDDRMVFDHFRQNLPVNDVLYDHDKEISSNRACGCYQDYITEEQFLYPRIVDNSVDRHNSEDYEDDTPRLLIPCQHKDCIVIHMIVFQKKQKKSRQQSSQLKSSQNSLSSLFSQYESVQSTGETDILSMLSDAWDSQVGL